jgi:hypothetical protein
MMMASTATGIVSSLRLGLANVLAASAAGAVGAACKALGEGRRSTDMLA